LFRVQAAPPVRVSRADVRPPFGRCRGASWTVSWAGPGGPAAA
jgi:hypothetical protein